MYISLHTAEPNEANLEATEVVYPEYYRTSLMHIPFVFTGESFGNAVAIWWPPCYLDGLMVTHFAIVNTESGPGRMLCQGELKNRLAIKRGLMPAFKPFDMDLFVYPDNKH